MSTDIGTDRGWHADDDLLAAYVAGRTRPPVTASVEMHLLHCARLPRRGDRARRPGAAAAGLGPRRGRRCRPRADLDERVAARLGLADRDALLVAAAPALRGAWLLGAAALPALRGHRACAQAGPRRLAALPVRSRRCVPVGAVAFAYGQDADPMLGDHPGRAVLTAAAAAPPRGVGGGRGPAARPRGRAGRCPGPPWVAVAWLVPAFACVALTLALSTWVTVSARRRRGLRVLGRARSLVAARTRSGSRAARSLSAPVLPVYVVIAVVAAAVFWLRSDRLSLLGRNS